MPTPGFDGIPVGPTPHPNPTPWPTGILPPLTTPPPATERPPSADALANIDAIPTLGPNDPFGVEVCSLIVPLPIKEAVPRFELIVIGTVKEVLPARWTTPDGQRPFNPHDPSESAYIFHPIQISVERYLKGETQEAELSVFVPGGAVGADSHGWCGDMRYDFHEGERVLIFLNPSEIGRALGYDSMWETWEHYSITPSQQAVNDSYDRPLEEVLKEIDDAFKKGG